MSSHGFWMCFLPGGVQLICNNMVTSTRAIVNTARSMVSTIMKFLDSGPGKATDGNLKARVMTSEPDNAEGLHNFAPLGAVIYFGLCYFQWDNIFQEIKCLSLYQFLLYS